MAKHPTLVPGTPAPAFELPAQHGGTRSLAEYLAQGPLLLAFHRGTW
jgi:peroxiredoxin